MITEWLNADGTLQRRTETPTSVAPCGSAGRVPARGRTIRAGCTAGGDPRAASPSLRVQQQLPADPRGLRLKVAGTSIDGRLVEMDRDPTTRGYVACQFHPEFTSTPRDGHPLFEASSAPGWTGSSSRVVLMRLCGFEAGLEHPFFLIAAPA